MFAHHAAPPDPALRRRALARDVAGAAGGAAAAGRATGCAISGATSSGSTARSARICAPSSARSIAVGGWADGYSNAIFRACSQASKCRARGWSAPGRTNTRISPSPARRSASCRRCLRWWDQWLKGIETGIMDEPMLRVWMQEPAPPRAALRPSGRGAGWPSRAGRRRRIEPAAPGARRRPRWRRPAPRDRRSPIASPQTVGLAAGEWCAYGLGGRTEPDDQREEDGGSLVFDTRAARPSRSRSWARRSSTLELASDRPVAFVAARALRGAPDGAVDARQLRAAQPHPSRQP